MDELDALWAFLVAAVVAFVATPPTARLARRLGVLNQPRDRDLHDHDVPGLGGLAILAAVVVAGALFLPDDRETRGILAGAVAIALVGALDDSRKGGLPPLVKLVGPVRGGGDPRGRRGEGHQHDAAVRGAAPARQLGHGAHARWGWSR